MSPDKWGGNRLLEKGQIQTSKILILKLWYVEEKVTVHEHMYTLRITHLSSHICLYVHLFVPVVNIHPYKKL